ncbi:hypothetical protein AZI85_05400 [Bdellovibrio bacteriovorus]|uniref:Lipoprotein n=1 Tax=Bdellovibrio bacteriovorus TaxID=959 RepID=A0A150WJ49_BDEBC|nr:hypothetical protein [Bdellovibrio bacteriovorus]KYG63465.1 hypothetical protein AZI85_05400 [Bdellovibrio bacteriovorus]
MKSVLLLIPVVLLSGCANFQRSTGSGYSDSTTQYSSDSRSGDSNYLDRDTRKTAYEMGKDPTSLTSRDIEDIRNRQKVRELERALGSKKEREQYSKILPWLKNDEEKIQFLSIPSIEGRQQWINRNEIWSRSQAPQQEMRDLVETQDIAVGMPQEYVRRSWGEPLAVEVSGNPIYKNERWKYQRHVSTSSGFRQETRFVYFEGGRVVGWETE